MSGLRFGVFLAPHHPIGEHPTLQIRRDVELVEHLDRLDTTLDRGHAEGSHLCSFEVGERVGPDGDAPHGRQGLEA